ncbi:hypothetical protein [Enterococcus sp.]|uniref:hypothetical protein n=1 Tax=Enterococcus sp. TaxID=35783 RepID=UPI0025C57061|nr:hypothetical protein [Enterococcus sp.]
MAEASIILIFLLLLLGIQIKEQSKIRLFAKTSKIKRRLSLFLMLIILLTFWPQILADQIKLMAFAIMIGSIGFLKEGLGEKQLIKFGLLNGMYQQFTTIQIEATSEKQTIVTFYKFKHNQLSLFFEEEFSVIANYFIKLGLSSKITSEKIADTKKNK